MNLNIAWWIVYTSLPVLLFPGSLGGFGEEAKKAADEVIQALGTLFIVVLIGGGIYLALRYLGVL